MQYNYRIKASVITIGNSKGIRIPKSVLTQCHIEDEVEMEVQNFEIILKPVQKVPRKNWEAQFKKELSDNPEENMLIPDSDLSEIKDWEW